MNRYFFQSSVRILWVALCMSFLLGLSVAKALVPSEFQKSNQQYYEWRTYYFKSEDQKKVVETYLRDAAIPALNRLGISPVGVFDEPDQKEGLKLHVLIPYKSLEQFEGAANKLAADAAYQKAAAPYLNTAHTAPAYDRIESSLMKAFRDMPILKVPKTQTPKRDRIYEFRRYESFSEKSGLKKIDMFNQGGGAKMPNLTYMTTFDSKESRDQHWAAFGSDPEWKKISGMEEYANTVSKADIYFLTPTEYSQI
jgi:hypothetical protein